MVTTVTFDVDVPADKIPELADVKWVSETFGITRRAVITAIQRDYLPAQLIGNSYAIRPRDAALLWGAWMHRRAVDASKN